VPTPREKCIGEAVSEATDNLYQLASVLQSISLSLFGPSNALDQSKESTDMPESVTMRARHLSAVAASVLGQARTIANRL
jgi:hypothetical protein